MAWTQPEIDARRLEKASALARVLVSAGACAGDVVYLDAPGRRAAEGLAGLGPSSAETWALVGDLLALGTLEECS